MSYSRDKTLFYTKICRTPKQLMLSTPVHNAVPSVLALSPDLLETRLHHTTGYSLLENYNNSVEKVLTLMTLYLKIVLNTDVFQHAILGSCWKFWRVAMRII